MGVEIISKKDDRVSRRTRDRSTTTFPYSDLGAAIEVARTIKAKAGISCEKDQLAAWMGHTATSGTFRSRHSSARLFGLIKTERSGRVMLTDLGQDILNPGKADRAKTKAFLNVDLFQKMYEAYKGNPLPPSTALKHTVGSFGVTPKQEDRARQTFTKSAEVANFIDPQTGIFIAPGFPEDNETVTQTTPSIDSDSEPGKNGGQDVGKSTLPPKLDPIILGLINRLPNPGDVWPIEERTLWLDILDGSFKLVYKDDNYSKENENNA